MPPKLVQFLILEKKSDPVPFDLSHLRHIEYENTLSGLKSLSLKLKESFDWIDTNQFTPDNHFLQLAKLTKYKFPQYSDEDENLTLLVVIVL